MSTNASRLSRSVEHQSKKQLYIFFLGSIIVIILFAVFSTWILDFIGTHMIRDESENESTSNRQLEVVAPPIFSSIPRASSTGTITLSGNVVSPNGTVEILVNNKKAATQKIESDTTFTIKNIKLSEGENTIKGQYTVGERTSEFTKDYIVLFSKEPPKIEIEHPGEGTEFKRGDQDIDVRGKTDVHNTVTVNGFRAVVDEDGTFSYLLKLNEGENTIIIKAVNPANAETEKSVKVTYRP